MLRKDEFAHTLRTVVGKLTVLFQYKPEISDLQVENTNT
jgi:hypothetical protein